MSVIDLQYVHSVSARLEKFARKKENLYTFRCPYCGDSTKFKNKTRGYFYQKNQTIFSNVIIVELAEHSLIS